MADRDPLQEALAARLTALPQVARLEPTLRDVVAATAAATAQRFSSSAGADTDPTAGVLINKAETGTDVTVTLSITTPPSARETAQTIRAAIAEVLAEHDQRPGQIVVTIIAIDP